MKNRRILSLVIAMAMLFSIVLPGTGYAYTERTATVNASSLNVRSGAGTNQSIVAKLTQGTGVTVINETRTGDGNLWYQIRFNHGGEKTGYALSSYIKFPVNYTTDGSFESYLSSQGFPESYKTGLRQLHAQYPNWVFTAQHTNLDWNTVIQNESIIGRNLISSGSISSWKSVADGAYNWDSSSWPGFDSSSWVAASEDIIRHYMDPRNFMDETYVFQFLRHSYDSSVHNKEGLRSLVAGSFLAGSTSAVGGGDTGSGNSGGTVNPDGSTDSGSSGSNSSGGGSGYGPGYTNSGNNSNNNSNSNSGSSGSSNVIGTSPPPEGTGSDVKLQGPSASISRKNTAVVATAYGPGMTGDTTSGADTAPAASSGSTSYVDILMNAGAQSGVNPYVLAAMIIQEQGTNGTGGSISGKISGYEGYYNFFNIEAYQSGSMSPVQRGLWYATQSGNYGRPWNSVDRSIAGGATFYGNNYVKAGQDTFYLKKYNVQGSNLYKHQYMTNVQGAAGEGAKLSKAYSASLKQTALEFKIPVYTNMPDAPCAKPSGDGSPNNKLAGLSVDGFGISPTFSKDTASYDLILDPSVSSIYIQASPISSGATVSGIGQIQLSEGNNELKISVKAQNGSVREYILRVARQQNGQTGSAQSSSTTGPGAESGGTNPNTSDGQPGGSGAVVVP